MTITVRLIWASGAGGCGCFRFGDIVHYRWASYEEPERGRLPHSASLVIGPSARSPLEFVQLPLSDTHYQFGMTSPLVAKSVAAWELCTDACPFNPDYEGVSS